MKTIVITAQKGGAGKTTLARNLAVAASQAGERVLCIDFDPQASLRSWWEAREADTPSMLNREPTPATLKSALKTLTTQFDVCIIDTPPAAPQWLREVIDAADLVLVPVRPSPDDLRAVGPTIAAIMTAKIPFAFILSQTPRARLTGEALRVLAKYGRVAPANFAQRISYAETAATGHGVTESTDTKACEEVSEVWHYVKEIL